MPTRILNGNSSFALQGSPERRIAQGPNGVWWAMVVVASGATAGTARFYYSLDSGSVWTWASDSDIPLRQNKALPSLHIDADGFAHVSWIVYDADPQIIRYARGTPARVEAVTPGVPSPMQRVNRAWSWRYLTVTPANGRAWNDSDIVAMKIGSSWRVFISYALARETGGCQVAQIAVSSAGTPSVQQVTIGPTQGIEAGQYGTIDFAHNGDGRTPLASPHLFLGTASIGTVAGIRLHRAAYSSGVWTWGTPVQVGTGNLTKTTTCGVWDGQRYMFAWAANTASISMVEWDGVNAPVTRSPPVLPGGTGPVLGLTLSCDPVTRDIYLAYHDGTDGDIRWSKFTRATLTWAAWTVVVSRSPATTDGQVSLPRHPPRNSIVMLYSLGMDPWVVYSTLLTTLVRTPQPPTQTSPAPGAKVDLEAGGIFNWVYNPIAPGDTESQFTFRRVNGPTTQYWNATTESWQSGVVNNATDQANPGRLVFPADKWVNGVTYTWAVRSFSTPGDPSAYSPARTVIAVAAPTVAVTAPFSVIYQDSSPLVEWTYTSTDPQRDYEIRVLAERPGIDDEDPVGAVWASGVVGSSIARSARIEVPLANNSAYRAYVRATSTANIISDWAYSSFNISVTPPNSPTIEVEPIVDVGTGVPRLRLNLRGRASLLDADQGSWEPDVNATVTAQAEDVESSLLAGIRVTAVASAASAARTVPGVPPTAPEGEPQPTGPLSFPVREGNVYTFRSMLRSGTSQRNIRLKIRWYDQDDGNGSLIGESAGPDVIAPNTGYILNNVTATAPVEAVLARLVVEVLNPVAGEQFYTGYMSFHPGDSLEYQPGGFSDRQTLRVERSDDGGLTWTTEFSRVRPDSRQESVTSDRLMPFGKPLLYRAYSDVDQGFGSVVTSGVSDTVATQVDSTAWAIRDITDDQGEINAYVIDHKENDDESSSVHRPVGRFYPIVDTEGLQASTRSIDIFAFAAERDAIKAVVTRTAVFVVQSPNGFIVFARLIRRTKTVEEQRHRKINIDYIEVDH